MHAIPWSAMPPHHASCLFWAVPFAAWQATRPARTGGELVRDAVLMAAVAAAVDYGATPEALHPGVGAGPVQNRHGGGLRRSGDRLRGRDHGEPARHALTVALKAAPARGIELIAA